MGAREPADVVALSIAPDRVLHRLTMARVLCQYLAVGTFEGYCHGWRNAQGISLPGISR